MADRGLLFTKRKVKSTNFDESPYKPTINEKSKELAVQGNPNLIDRLYES